MHTCSVIDRDLFLAPKKALMQRLESRHLKIEILKKINRNIWENKNKYRRCKYFRIFGRHLSSKEINAFWPVIKCYYTLQSNTQISKKDYTRAYRHHLLWISARYSLREPERGIPWQCLQQGKWRLKGLAIADTDQSRVPPRLDLHIWSTLECAFPWAITIAPCAFVIDHQPQPRDDLLWHLTLWERRQRAW